MIRLIDNQTNRYIIHIDVVYMIYSCIRWTNEPTQKLIPTVIVNLGGGFDTSSLSLLEEEEVL